MKTFISLTAVALLLIPALAMPAPMNLFPAGGPILGYDLSLLLMDLAGIYDDPDPVGPGRSINADPKGGPVDFGLDKIIRDDPDASRSGGGGKGGPVDFGLNKVIHDAPEPVGMSVKGKNR